MFKISSNGIITMNRGDSFEFPLILKTGNSVESGVYSLQENDVVYLGIMEPNQPFESAIIRKKFTYADLDADGNINIIFKPKDTQCLIPGKYYYQVKLQTFLSDNTYDVETVIEKSLFYIQE